MERMGEGTFSEVLKCQSLLDGKLYACKKMKQRYRRCTIRTITYIDNNKCELGWYDILCMSCQMSLYSLAEGIHRVAHALTHSLCVICVCACVCACVPCSAEQVNNLREVQALKRLNPHTNVIELKEVIL